MGVNKHRGHLYIVPEDDANRQMANGFEKDCRVRGNAIHTDPPTGGWRKALEKLKIVYFGLLESNPNTHVLVLIDCDEDADRIKQAIAEVPIAIRDRVFIIGTLDEPETLKSSLNVSFEEVGERVAQACFDSHLGFWHHEQLEHNATEVARLQSTLSKIVFKD